MPNTLILFLKLYKFHYARGTVSHVLCTSLNPLAELPATTNICVPKSITKKWLYQILSTLKIRLKPTLIEIFTHKKFGFSQKSAYNIADSTVFLTADRYHY